MDSLTQLVLGGAVGYAVIGNKVGRKAALWGAALGTLPDLDVLIPFDSAVEAFTYHRSFSHSLLMHLLISPVIVWLILKLHSHTKDLKVRWFWMVFLCLSTHAILDSFTVYGTQLLWPITEFPFAFSNLFIIDLMVTVPLLIGVIAALLPRVTLQNSVRINNVGLLLACTYIGWSLIAKLIIDTKTEAALAQQSIQYDKYLSTPAPFTTLLWRSVVMSDGRYYEIYTSIFDRTQDVSIDAYETKPYLLEAVKNDWSVNRLQWFTKGFYAVKQRDEDIFLSDLRMGVECSYVFNFKVAKESNGQIRLGNFEEFSQRPDISNLKYIWQRIWDPKVSLAPSKAAVSDC
jgi:inner membrane protein